MLSFISCKKENPVKDLDNAVNKIKAFNTKFEEFYSDGIISKESSSEKEKSEYETLKKIATQYYDIMNKINTNIKLEKKDLNKGETIGKYQAEYERLVKEREKEIKEITEIFNENLTKFPK